MAEAQSYDIDKDALPNGDLPDSTQAKAAADPPPAPEGENQKALEEAKEWKEKGNAYFRAQDYLGALECYDSAIAACPGEDTVPEKPSEQPPPDPYVEGSAEFGDETTPGGRTVLPGQIPRDRASEGTEASERVEKGEPASIPEEKPAVVPRKEPSVYAGERAVFHCNRAACLQSLGRHEEAVEASGQAGANNPKYVKAWMRRSQALMQLERYSEASQDMEVVLQLEPGNKVARERKAKCDKLQEEKMEKLKEETLGKLKDLGNSILGNFGLSTNNFKFDKDETTGSYNMQFVQNPNP